VARKARKASEVLLLALCREPKTNAEGRTDHGSGVAAGRPRGRQESTGWQPWDETCTDEMGIKGLRAALKECQLVDGHIKDWAGKTVVVDGYAWLHKVGSLAWRVDLAMITSRLLPPSFSSCCSTFDRGASPTLFDCDLLTASDLNAGGLLVRYSSLHGRGD